MLTLTHPKYLLELFLTEVVLGYFNSVPPRPDIYQLRNSVPDINCSLNTALSINYQHPRELTGARKTSHKHNTKDLMYLWWSLCILHLLACQVSYRRRFRTLVLCLCDVFRAPVNSLVCW